MWYIKINRGFNFDAFDQKKKLNLPTAAARIRLSFSAIANAASSTRPPRAVFTRNAPELK